MKLEIFMSEEKEEQLKQFVLSDGRVCPQPYHWNKLWEMLPDRKRLGSVWEPPPPLILGAWRDASAGAKRMRLFDHIRYAADHGVLDQVDRYLRDLNPDQWYCINKRS